jgi:hypothetical protein
MEFRLWWGLLGCALLMVAILIGAPYSDDIAFLPDQGASWYYWKLPDPDVASRISAWLSYGLHQLSIWWLIWLAQTRKLKYTGGLHRINVIALATNAVFIAWHIVQTRVFYDGLAQDVSIWSSLGSVAILLMLVIIMENRRRGVVFGKSWSALDEPGRFLRKYHGYYFSWAVIYTFWYHPIEDTLGHMLGTFYVIMLMLQGSLFFTRSHLNRGWTTFLETFVLFHGAVVAWLAIDDQSWEMFFFGFAAIFVITQMHGLGLGAGARWLIGLGYLVGWAWAYWPELGFGFLEAMTIPMIYLLSVPALALLIRYLFLSRRAPPPG